MRRSRSVARRVARKTAKAQRRKVSRKRRSRSASRLRTAKRVSKRVSKVARRSNRRSSRRRVNRKNRNRRTLRGGSPSPRDGGRGAFPMTFHIDVTEGKKEIDDFFKKKKQLVVAVDVVLKKAGGSFGPVDLKYSIRQFNEPGKSITAKPLEKPMEDDNYNFFVLLHNKHVEVKFTIQGENNDRVFKMLVLGNNSMRARNNPVFTRYYYAEPLDLPMQSELSGKGVLLTPDMITPGSPPATVTKFTSPVFEVESGDTFTGITSEHPLEDKYVLAEPEE